MMNVKEFDRVAKKHGYKIVSKSVDEYGDVTETFENDKGVIDKVRRKAYKKVEEINSRAIIEIKQALVLMKILTVSPMVNRGAQS